MMAKVNMVASDIDVPVSNILQGLRDVVVAKIFSFIWEGTYDIKAFQMAFSEDWAGSLEVMMGFLANQGDPFQPNVLCPPDIPLSDVLGALRSGHVAINGALDKEATMYSVLHHLFAWIAQPPFVTQQLRLLYNTAICISCCYSAISSFQSLLVLLLRRSTLLLAQPDLVPLCANIYTWAVGHLIKRIQLDNRSYEDVGHIFAATAEILLKAGLEGRGHAQVASQRLLNDLENIVSQAAEGRSPKLAEIAATAASLWPRSLPIQTSIDKMLSSLESSRGGIGSARAIGHMVEYLESTKVEFPKHRLAQALWQCFSKVTPHVLRANSEATRAMVDMLSYTSGQVAPLGLGEDTSSEQNVEASLQEIKNNLVLNVQNMLGDASMSMAHTAFQTMTCVLSVSQVDRPLSPESATIASLHTTKLSWSPSHPPGVLSELLSGDKWLKKSRNRPVWQTDFSLLLIDILSVKDIFFTQIRTLAKSSSTFAQESVPLLVLATLAYAREQNRLDIPEMLSKYFEAILASETGATEDIINLAVYLRRYIPPADKAEKNRKLARDEWLQVSWRRLAAGAVSVRAYTTALLFLELAAEHEKNQDGLASDIAVVDHSLSQEILYTVYTNLSEPDSFYGINPYDLQEGMIRRMQHEGRWTDAMVWHGGAYENRHDAQATGAIGIVQSLAASGLPRLAMNMLSSTGTVSSAASLPGSLAYDLAWKTERWDLPSTFSSGHETADASLFRALRAAQRELDPEKVKRTIGECLSRETLKLANAIANSQSLSESDIGSLLSVRQVHQWIELRDRQPDLEFWQSSDLHSLRYTFIAKRACSSIKLSNAFLISFHMYDRLASTRLTLLEAHRTTERRNQISDEPSDLEVVIAKSEREHLLALSSHARSAKNLQKAVNSVIRASNLEDPTSYAVRFELACVMWAQGEHTVAVDALHRIAKEISSGKLSLLPSEEVNLMSHLVSAEMFDYLHEANAGSTDRVTGSRKGDCKHQKQSKRDTSTQR
jgi:ataxia telangiectasia mutated family protein